MNNHINTPAISTNDIIIKITGQQLIDMGYHIGTCEPEDNFNLRIDISEQKIKIAPDVDGGRGSFDCSYEFDYNETLSDLNDFEYLPNTICGGIEYWYNDDCTESSSSCNPSEIASICGLSVDELAAFNSLDHLNKFVSGNFSFSYEPKYICPEAILNGMEQIDIHIDMDAKKITCFNSRKGISLLGTVYINMKKKVIEILNRKEELLQEVLKLQEAETKKSKLNDLDKNEIEIKAQISILRHLLSE